MTPAEELAKRLKGAEEVVLYHDSMRSEYLDTKDRALLDAFLRTPAPVPAGEALRLRARAELAEMIDRARYIHLDFLIDDREHEEHELTKEDRDLLLDALRTPAPDPAEALREALEAARPYVALDSGSTAFNLLLAIDAALAAEQRGTGRTFARGDMVRKIKGSQWEGRVVGEYSTDLTPEGYAVESASHPGAVQIYPASALERVTNAEPGPCSSHPPTEVESGPAVTPGYPGSGTACPRCNGRGYLVMDPEWEPAAVKCPECEGAGCSPPAIDPHTVEWQFVPKKLTGDMAAEIECASSTEDLWKGSQWEGRVVGEYSTDLTPEGYAVESASHPGAVQIYPASALERVTNAEPGPCSSHPPTEVESGPAVTPGYPGSGTACPRCNGRGYLVMDPEWEPAAVKCPECEGAGCSPPAIDPHTVEWQFVPKKLTGDMAAEIECASSTEDLWKGSQWEGRVVGEYSTDLTPEGYAVESASHPGAVQIYPASALERVTNAEPGPCSSHPPTEVESGPAVTPGYPGSGTACPRCNGRGYLVMDPEWEPAAVKCPECEGAGCSPPAIDPHTVEWQFVPKKLTGDMAAEIECASSTEDLWTRALAAAPPAPVDGWRTIDSAPKDGTWILAYAPDGDWSRVSWGRNRGDELCWCSTRYWWREHERKFTHWHPLPAPPPPEKKEGE